MKSDIRIMYDEYELTKNMDLLESIDFGLLPGVDNGYQSYDSRIGSDRLTTAYKPRILELKFIMYTENLVADRDNLNRALFHNQTNRLSISVFPRRYWNAFVEGETSFVRDMEELRKVYVTIPFVLPENIAHSFTTKSFDAKENVEGVLEFEINNKGSESVPITYRIKNSKDNGYLGIVSEHGAMQFGKIDEADGEPYKKNEQLISTKTFSSFPNFSGTNPQDSNKATNGTLTQSTIEGYPVLRLSSAGSGGGWHGGMKMIDIPEDSEGHKGAKNFYCFFNSWFETGAMGQTGCVNISFFTADNELICSYIIEKVDTSGNRARVLFQHGGENPTVYKSDMNFTPSNVTAENPFKSTEGKGDIIKEGDTVRLWWRGQRFHATVPDLAEKECAKIGIYIGQLGSRNLTKQHVTRCYLRELVFQKLNVDKWRDTPNRYPKGSELIISGEETRLYVNGLAALDDEVKGADYFKAPPGKTKVQLYASEFTEIESATAVIREAWL